MLYRIYVRDQPVGAAATEEQAKTSAASYVATGQPVRVAPHPANDPAGPSWRYDRDAKDWVRADDDRPAR